MAPTLLAIWTQQLGANFTVGLTRITSCQPLELHGQIDSALSPVSWLLICSFPLGCTVLALTLASPKPHAMAPLWLALRRSTEFLLRLHLQLALLLAAGSQYDINMRMGPLRQPFDRPPSGDAEGSPSSSLVPRNTHQLVTRTPPSSEDTLQPPYNSTPRCR
ncbi:hypothetical protein M3J09_007502 [Ascochyta lentis]